MKVLEIVRAKVKNTDITTLDLQLAIDEVETTIKNYCNIDKVPNDLKYTWANMATDLALYQHSVNNAEGDLDDFDISLVSNLKVGDTQFALQGNNSEKSKALKSHRPNLDTIVMNYKAQLNRFRRMVW